MTVVAGTRLKPKTRSIAGHELRLIAGRRYLAIGPLPSKNVHGRFDVMIADATEGSGRFDAPAAVVPGLCYDAAKELRDAFAGCGRGVMEW